MLPTNLNTNEVKNAAGTEVEFGFFSEEGRTRTYAQVGEAPNREHRIKFAHSESGADVEMRRRSLCRVDKAVTGVSGAKRNISFYVVGDIPVGDLADLSEPKNVCAELMSLMASQGATTTILFDCTGYGAASVTGGSL